MNQNKKYKKHNPEELAREERTLVDLELSIKKEEFRKSRLKKEIEIETSRC